MGVVITVVGIIFPTVVDKVTFSLLVITTGEVRAAADVATVARRAMTTVVAVVDVVFIATKVSNCFSDGLK